MNLIKFLLITFMLVSSYQTIISQVQCNLCGDDPPFSLCCSSIQVPLGNSGDSVTVLYQWRKCNGVWEMKIINFIVPEEATNYTKKYDLLQALVLSYITFNNPMNFPPDSIPDGEILWRIIQPACWSITNSYTYNFDEFWTSCDTTICCIKTFKAKIIQECNGLLVEKLEETSNGDCNEVNREINPEFCFPVCNPFKENEENK